MKNLQPMNAFGVCLGAALLAACSGMNFSPSAPTALVGNLRTGYKSIFQFNGSGGGGPTSTLLNLNGTLYGLTAAGGSENDGTVFKITTSGDETSLYNFNGGSDGAGPTGGLLDVNGTLYGTTTYGGSVCATTSEGCGTFFSVTPSGGETVLYRFNGTDGANPNGTLLDVNGTLYGTTTSGGRYGYGTVFSMSTLGKEKVLHNFGKATDGCYPIGSLIDVSGLLYGVTMYGGSSPACVVSSYFAGLGTVFTVTFAGKEKVLYRFNGANGEEPIGGLIDVNGTLYGTTGFGGKGCSGGYDGCGTFFSITTSGTEHVLYTFKGSPDGEAPSSTLTDVNGTLYGSTLLGGTGDASECAQGACGTLFAVSTAGKEKVLYSFKGSPDGYNPLTNLTDLNNVLYGTTRLGGSYYHCLDLFTSCGTIFKYTL